MKRCINASPRRPLATATKTINSRKPIGSSQSRLNHRLRPTRTRGAIPLTCGTDPAQVAGVDHILARRQLIAVAANDVRRDTRPLICRQILRRGVGIRVHSPAAYAVKHQRQETRLAVDRPPVQPHSIRTLLNVGTDDDQVPQSGPQSASAIDRQGAMSPAAWPPGRSWCAAQSHRASVAFAPVVLTPLGRDPLSAGLDSSHADRSCLDGPARSVGETGAVRARYFFSAEMSSSSSPSSSEPWWFFGSLDSSLSASPLTSSLRPSLYACNEVSGRASCRPWYFPWGLA